MGVADCDSPGPLEGVCFQSELYGWIGSLVRGARFGAGGRMLSRFRRGWEMCRCLLFMAFLVVYRQVGGWLMVARWRGPVGPAPDDLASELL